MFEDLVHMTVVVKGDCSEMELGLAAVAFGSSGSTLAPTWCPAKRLRLTMAKIKKRKKVEAESYID